MTTILFMFFGGLGTGAAVEEPSDLVCGTSRLRNSANGIARFRNATNGIASIANATNGAARLGNATEGIARIRECC